MPTNATKPRTVRAKPTATSAPKPATTRFVSAGDTSRALCHHCNALRETVYQYRTVPLEASKLTVPNVLVGVCTTCDTAVSLPAQSTPRISEARERTMTEQNARIPLELEDRLNMMAHEFDFRPAPFKGALCRYVLFRVANDKTFARLVWAKARNADARGTPGAKVKFRTEEALPQAAMAVAAKAGINELSAVLRGGMLAVSEPLAAGKDQQAIRRDLQLLGVGSGS